MIIKKTLRRALLAMVAAALTLSLLGAAGLLLARDQLLQWQLSGMTTGPATAAMMRLDDGTEHRVWTRGIAAPAEAEPPSGDEHVRIGSVTKTFVATVVLQLVDEGTIGLDDPVEGFLPGSIPNGEHITIRQLLNHTSGLYDYMSEPGMSTNRWRGAARYRTWTLNELVEVAAAHPPYHAPGETFRYANTNYVVLGLMIEHATSATWSEEVEGRIVEPLELAGTEIPGDDPTLPVPHLSAEHTLPDGSLADVTEQNETLDGPAGAIISTQADLARFFDALLGGRLLSPETLREMMTTVPMGMGFHYGLGLQRYDPPCGSAVWGHGGQLLGYLTYAFRSTEGRSVILSVASAQSDAFVAFAALMSTAYCAV